MTNKLKYFIGNWKMFGDLSSFQIIYKIHAFYKKFKFKGHKSKIVLCVPSTLIYFFNKKLKSKFIDIGGQNCHYEKDYGPYTGALSAGMLKHAGAKYVILGHSENRSTGDTNTIIKKKIGASLSKNLKVIFCIGETISEKNKGKKFSVLKKQINNSINKNFDLKKIIIAYEPVWAIGSSKIPKYKDLKKTFIFIKQHFKKRFRTKKTPIVLYGGSVNHKNITMFSSISEIDGFLIGGASQSSKKFIDIIKNYYK
tara:strand:- start:1656 stop:2417 length:762 start_codon:yes stop_codon:yes gene_type:complete